MASKYLFVPETPLRLDKVSIVIDDDEIGQIAAVQKRARYGGRKFALEPGSNHPSKRQDLNSQPVSNNEPIKRKKLMQKSSEYSTPLNAISFEAPFMVKSKSHLPAVNRIVQHKSTLFHLSDDDSINQSPLASQEHSPPPIKARRRLVKKSNNEVATPSIISKDAVGSDTPEKQEPQPLIIEISSSSSEDEESDDSSDIEATAFFNTCTNQQLKDIGFSMDLAGFLVDARPFCDIDELRSKLSTHKKQKTINNLIDKYLDMLKCYKDVDRVIQRCEKQGNEIVEVLNKLGVNIGSIDGGLNIPQPKAMRSDLPLKAGVAWLSCLYEKQIGCILADEMGLGKTTQIIGMIAHLKGKEVPGARARHLIIVPASVIDNWVREFERFAPDLHVFKYYGTANERMEKRLQLIGPIKSSFDVMITTYNVASGGKTEFKFLKKLKCSSLILDEGHQMKNVKILLTGTPVNNNLQELLALLSFVAPDIITKSVEYESIEKLFSSNSTQKDLSSVFLSTDRITRAKHMIAPFILRRSKEMVLSELPRKISIVQHCIASKVQLDLYHAITGNMNEDYEKLLEDIGEDDANIAGKRGGANLLMQLRKAANHPLLIRKHYRDNTLRILSTKLLSELEYCDSDAEIIYEDLSFMSDQEINTLCEKHKTIRSFALEEKLFMESAKVEKLQELLPVMIENGDRILIFSQFVTMLDILEKVMTIMDISFMRMDGQTKVTERQFLIDDFNQGDVSVFLLSTRACGLGLNLTSANVVVLHDMDFNPHNDAQAEDRVHRVGQKSQVQVIRLIVQDTVEQHIYDVGQLKLKLDKEIKSAD